MDRRGPTRTPDVAELALFAGCRREELAQIRSLLTVIRLPAGEVVIECGAPPREFAVIADGEVAVCDGNGVEIAVLGPGSIVGELGLLREAPAGATVTTLTPVVAYVGNRREFVSMLHSSAIVDRHVLHAAIDRLPRQLTSARSPLRRTVCCAQRN